MQLKSRHYARKTAVMRLLRAARFAESHVRAYQSRLLVRGDRQPPKILERHEGTGAQNGANWSVVVHFDLEGRIGPSLRSYVTELSNAGFAVVIVSNAPSLNLEDLSLVKPLVALILRRENIGYDFAAYAAGLAEVFARGSPDQVLFANDSVEGPFTSLSTLLARCDDSADVWGMTDSHERVRHLQSYFLLFKKRALAHRAFVRFWETYSPYGSKDWAIINGELRLSRQMASAGLRLKALFPETEARAAFQERCERLGIASRWPQGGPAGPEEILAIVESGLPMNITHFLWDTLIEQGFPFVKRELIHRNPGRIVGVDAWRDKVAAKFGAGCFP